MNEARSSPRAPIEDAAASRRRGLRAVPLRLLIPNLVTLFALGLGLTAIRLAMEGSIEWAVSAIAGAAVLDGLDGRIARALKGTSRFGAELDLLADFVDFGVAPALVLYVANLHAAKSFGWVAALLFAMACALRLARFNVMIDEDQPAWRKLFFVGMPAPAGAIVGLLPIYLHYAFDLGPAELTVRRGRKPLRAGGGASDGEPRAAFLRQVDRPRAARICGGGAGRRRRRAPASCSTFPMQALVAVTLAYLASIPFAVRRYRALDRAAR